jgi:hypothetical protein
VDLCAAHFRYGGISFALQNYYPTHTLGLLDSSTGMVKRRAAQFARSGIIPHPGLKAASVLPPEMNIGFFCHTPNKNAKLTAPPRSSGPLIPRVLLGLRSINRFAHHLQALHYCL